MARHREPRQLSGWKDDMGHPEQHRAAPGRCPLGREVFPDRYRIFTDEILSTQADVTCWEAIPTHCLEAASNLCVFWPLAKLTWKILPKEYVDSEPMVDGREETSGTGCTNLCVPALGHRPGNGFATLLAALQKAHSPHWVLI